MDRSLSGQTGMRSQKIFYTYTGPKCLTVHTKFHQNRSGYGFRDFRTMFLKWGCLKKILINVKLLQHCSWNLLSIWADGCKNATWARNAGKYCPDAWRHSKNWNSKFWKSKKNILVHLSKWDWVYTYHFLIRFVTLIKIRKTIFLVMKISSFITSPRQNSDNWKRNELESTV